MGRTRATDRYRYPQQDMDIRRGDELHLTTGDAFGDVDAVDRVNRHIDVKKAGAMKDTHPSAFFAHSVVHGGVMAESLYRFGERVARTGLAGRDAHTSAAELLQRRAPQLTGAAPLFVEGEAPLDAACRLLKQLDRSYLPIQGPPGSGTTYNGAHMSAELVRAGKKVGVTAVSHKVIGNLLEKVVEFAARDRTPISIQSS